MPFKDPEARKAYQREYRARTRERKRERENRRHRQRPDLARARSRRYYAKHRHALLAKQRQRRRADRERRAVLARTKLYQAVRDGTVSRPDTCSLNDASCVGAVHAHHNDYEKPLEVTWLCASHHRRLHRSGEAGPSSSLSNQ